MRKAALGLLILCNLIWTFNSVMGKSLVNFHSGVQVAWFRYAGGFLAFLLVAFAMVVLRKRKWREYFVVPKDFRTALDLFILGIGPFALTPILQFVGLETTQAMDNSILIATEPLITVLLAWAVLGEKMNRDHWVSMGLAVVGFGFFSGLLQGLYAPGAMIFSAGMMLLVFAQVGEGAYSVFSRKLVQVHEPKAVLGTAMAIGVTLLSLFVLCFDEFPDFGKMDSRQVGAVLWLGPLGSTATYLIWAMIARSVTIASMAVTLFIQPIAGAIIGYWLLGESLTADRALGAVLILMGIAYLALREIYPSSEKNACGL